MASSRNRVGFWSSSKTKVLDDRTFAFKGWRMLDQEGDERDWVLGETRPWVIGFYDKDLEDIRWSPMMDLTLISGAPTKKTVKPEPKIATVDDNGGYSVSYPFTAIDGGEECTLGTQCNGWSLTGTYEVKTPAANKSSIVLEVQVVPPASFKFNLRHRFGVTWTIEYADGRVESFIAYYVPGKGKFV